MKILLNKRLISILIDLGLLGILCIPIAFVVLLFFDNLLIQIFLLSCIYTFILCKDLLMGGRSIGKQKVNLSIKMDSNKTVSYIRLILRNIFLFIWPIDIIFIFINPEKKLGDYIFGTKVDLSDDKEIPPIKKTISILYFSFVLLVIFVIFYLISQVLYQNPLIRLLWA